MTYVSNIFGKLFTLIISLMFIVLLGYLGWMIGDRTPPILALEFEVETPNVTQGDKLKIRVRFVTQKFCRLHYDRFLISVDTDVRVDLPPLDYEAGIGIPGQPEEFVIEIDVPLDFPPGLAKYRVIPTDKCNIVHSFWPIRESVRDTEFKVTKANPDKIDEQLSDALKGILTDHDHGVNDQK